MQLEAIYNNGRLKFMQPVRFIHDKFKIRVEVPEHEVVVSTQKLPDESRGAQPDEWLDRLEIIKKEIMQTPEDELPVLTAKQQQNIRAFALREDR